MMIMDTKTKNKIRKELKNKKNIEECAKDFCVLGDPTKLKICYLLCRYKELTVSDLAEFTGVSISAVSHALGSLKRCFKIKTRREFRHVYYSFKSNHFVKGLIEYAKI